MDSNIKNVFNNVFSHISDLNKSKEIVKEWFQNFLMKVKNDQEHLTLVSHLVTKILRMVYQENLASLLNAGLDSQNYLEFGINVTNLIVWMSDEQIIDYYSFLVIIEDILETFPIKNLEVIFDIIESNLKNKQNSHFKDSRTNSNTMLKIFNTILKRLSSSMDTKFRGKVQMALASIFPLSDKSGLNLKGLYNLNNAKISLNNESKFHSGTNYQFYKQFWTVFKYITNPLSLFLSSEEEEPLKMLSENMDIQETICLDGLSSPPKFEIFVNNILRILTYFKNNHVELTEGEDVLVSYPKYLNGDNLFSLQLKDYSFRMTILTQYWIVFSSFLRPVSIQQKKAFVLNEVMKDRVNEVLKQISSLLKNYPVYGAKLPKLLKDEQDWEVWKEKGCPSFEKFPSADIRKELEEIKQKILSRKNKISRISRSNPVLFKIDTFNSYDFNSKFKINMENMLDFKNPSQYYESFNSDNPFIGNYLERVMKDNDPEMEIEDAISKIDETFNWKLQRLVSFYDITKITNENKASGIVKDYADKYKRNGYEFSVKEANPTTKLNEAGIVSIVNNADKEKQISQKFINNKRSPERRSNSRNQSRNKKRKFDHN